MITEKTFHVRFLHSRDYGQSWQWDNYNLRQGIVDQCLRFTHNDLQKAIRRAIVLICGDDFDASFDQGNRFAHVHIIKITGLKHTKNCRIFVTLPR